MSEVAMTNCSSFKALYLGLQSQLICLRFWSVTDFWKVLGIEDEVPVSSVITSA